MVNQNWSVLSTEFSHLPNRSTVFLARSGWEDPLKTLILGILTCRVCSPSGISSAKLVTVPAVPDLGASFLILE